MATSTRIGEDRDESKTWKQVEDLAYDRILRVARAGADHVTFKTIGAGHSVRAGCLAAIAVLDAVLVAAEAAAAKAAGYETWIQFEAARMGQGDK